MVNGVRGQRTSDVDVKNYGFKHRLEYLLVWKMLKLQKNKRKH